MNKKIIPILFSFFLILFLGQANFVSAAPSIDSLSSNSGAVGDEVLVNGFAKCSSTIVFYDGATPKSPTATATPIVHTSLGCTTSASQFKFNVPILAVGAYQIRLEDVDGASNPMDFTITVPRPTITSITPNQGAHNDPIEINGTDFDPNPENNLVQFVPIIGSSIGSHNLTPSFATATKLTVHPTQAFSFGNYTISVFKKIIGNWPEANYNSGINRNFSLKPRINNLNPSSGLPSSPFDINGVYFGADLAQVEIRFYRGTNIEIQFAPDQILSAGASLRTSVPDLAGGIYVVKVAVRGVESLNSQNFSVGVPDLIIDSFAPDFERGNPNDLMNFSAQVSGGAPPYSYAINWGDNQTQNFTDVNFSHRYASAATYVVTFTVRDGSVPPKTAIAGTSITITATPIPVSAAISANPTSVQVNTDFNLRITARAPSGGYIHAIDLYKGSPPYDATDSILKTYTSLLDPCPTTSAVCEKTFLWREPSAGNYKYFVEATDNNNARANSSEVTVAVTAAGTSVGSAPTGAVSAGIVPCGRRADDLYTEVNEQAQCTFSHFFVMFKTVVDFALKVVIFPLAVLMIAFGGFMYIINRGEGKVLGVADAKEIITAAVIGLAIILFSWIIINTLFGLLGVQKWTGLVDDPDTTTQEEGWWNLNTERVCQTPMADKKTAGSCEELYKTLSKDPDPVTGRSSYQDAVWICRYNTWTIPPTIPGAQPKPSVVGHCGP